MLDLQDAEREELEARFDAVVGCFDMLDKYDATGAEPLATTLSIANVLREDVSSKLISREELLKNAPEQHDGYFRVPATID